MNRDAYLLQLVRYIHLNPARAGIANDPSAYPWSGHLGYLGKRRIDWLSTHWVLTQFAADTTVARERYERYVLAGSKEGHRTEFHTGSEGGRMLGDDRFIKRVFKEQGERWGHHSRTPGLKRLVEIVCAKHGVEPATLIHSGKSRQDNLKSANTAVGQRCTAEDDSSCIPKICSATSTQYNNASDPIDFIIKRNFSKSLGGIYGY